MLDLMEKLILVTIDEETGKLVRAHYVGRYGLAAAMVLELNRLGKVTLQGKKLIILDEASTGNQLLDDALVYMLKKGRELRTYRFIGSNMFVTKARKKVLESLKEKGVIKEEQRFFMGLIPLKRYQVIERNERKALDEETREAYLSGPEVEDRKAIFASLLSVCRASRLVLDKYEYRENKQKLRKIEKGEYFQTSCDILPDTLKAVKYAISAEAAAAGAAG